MANMTYKLTEISSGTVRQFSATFTLYILLRGEIVVVQSFMLMYYSLFLSLCHVSRTRKRVLSSIPLKYYEQSVRFSGHEKCGIPSRSFFMDACYHRALLTFARWHLNHFCRYELSECILVLRKLII